MGPQVGSGIKVIISVQVKRVLLQSGSDAPSHRINDPMSLELHMADERVRAAGLSPAEREWRMFAFCLTFPQIYYSSAKCA